MRKLVTCIHIIKMLLERGRTQNEIVQEVKERWPEMQPPSKRTFLRYKQYILDCFSLNINFNPTTKLYELTRNARYRNKVLDYLISMYETENSASLLAKHHNLINILDFPTGTDKLDIIMKAIDEKRGIRATYTSFTKNTTKERTYIPIFLTMWNGRWYCVAEVTSHKESLPFIYALERFEDISITEECFKPRYTGTCDEYFAEDYGIYHHNEMEQVETIIIKVCDKESRYMQSKPLHPSQQDVTADYPAEEGFHYYSYQLFPCYDFYKRLMSLRENMEVISPASVRKEMAEIVRKVYKKYEKDF